eukprot:6173813-Pleurochrysis_carterae.AAC.2
MLCQLALLAAAVAPKGTDATAHAAAATSDVRAGSSIPRVPCSCTSRTRTDFRLHTCARLLTVRVLQGLVFAAAARKTACAYYQHIC